MLEYFNLLFKLIGRSLVLDQQAWEIVATYRQARSLVLGIIFLAGVSSLLGQSVILFVNHVRRNRFVFSLLFNGLILIVSYLVWGLVIGLVGAVLFPVTPTIGSMLRLVGLSATPLIFGFFVLMPYVGTAIGKALHVWSLIILISVVKYQFQTDFILAAATVFLGWLLMILLTKTIGKPAVKLRNKLWEKTTDTTNHKTAQDILLDFSLQNLD